MLLISPPRCDFFLRTESGKQTGFTSRRFSTPTWPTARSIFIPTSPRSPKPSATLTTAPTKQAQSIPSTSTINMSYNPDTPRSLPFSPTLGSIPEVFEYESLDAKDEAKLDPATPDETQETPDSFIPEPSTIAQPTLTKTTSRAAIIQSPPRQNGSARAVAKVLRKVLEADRARRKQIMRVYLKAIVFLKYLWRANERYGNVMVTTGMYMHR